MTEVRLCPSCGGEVSLHHIVFADGVIEHAGHRVRLSPSQGLIFGRLMDRAPAPVSRERLYNLIYGDGPADGEMVEDRIVDTYVSRIRRAIAPMGLEIETIRGEGAWRLASTPAVQHAAHHRKHKKGGIASMLTPEQIAEVKRQAAAGATQTAIATSMRVTYRAVHAVLA